MSIVTRPKRLNKSVTSSSPSETATLVSAKRNEAEAPEVGTRHREAPENRQGRLYEAPDAGQGRASFFEHEFTHGRSQS